MKKSSLGVIVMLTVVSFVVVKKSVAGVVKLVVTKEATVVMLDRLVFVVLLSDAGEGRK